MIEQITKIVGAALDVENKINTRDIETLNKKLVIEQLDLIIENCNSMKWRIVNET